MDLYLSHREHMILHYNQRKLESRHNVKIVMPDLQKNLRFFHGEIIVVKIMGDRRGVESVQEFLKQKSESTSYKPKSKKPRLDISEIDLVPNNCVENPKSKKHKNRINPRIDIVISEVDLVPKNGVAKNPNTRKSKRKKKSKNHGLLISAVNLVPNKAVAVNPSPTCEVTSTTNADESVIVLNISVGDVRICTNPPNEEPLSSEVQVVEELVVLSSDEENTVDQKEHWQVMPRPIIGTRVLRPIVIDGSNVARRHGGPDTFSCEGIKISVDYFLNRGHTQVTAFVPHYRKFNKSGKIETTDQHILEELEKTQHVVFTPTGCYDDRFIVELAANNGGVILSNDHYRDLLKEDLTFAASEAIKKRLLKFCFAGDLLMIPKDPRGRDGPKIEEYLSFPPSVSDNSS